MGFLKMGTVFGFYSMHLYRPSDEGENNELSKRLDMNNYFKLFKGYDGPPLDTYLNSTLSLYYGYALTITILLLFL